MVINHVSESWDDPPSIYIYHNLTNSNLSCGGLVRETDSNTDLKIWVKMNYYSAQITSRPHEPTDFPQMVAFSKGNGTPAISGKSRLVKYYNLARLLFPRFLDEIRPQLWDLFPKPHEIRISNLLYFQAEILEILCLRWWGYGRAGVCLPVCLHDLLDCGSLFGSKLTLPKSTWMSQEVSKWVITYF